MFTLPSTHRQARDLGGGVKCAQGGRKKASVEVKVESSACQLCYDLVSRASGTLGYTFDKTFFTTTTVTQYNTARNYQDWMYRVTNHKHWIQPRK